MQKFSHVLNDSEIIKFIKSRVVDTSTAYLNHLNFVIQADMFASQQESL